MLYSSLRTEVSVRLKASLTLKRLQVGKLRVNMQKIIVSGTVLGVVILVGIGMIFALRAPRTAPKTYPADKGPDFIDVAAYPAKMQELYNLFTNKCSRCHTVARPINSTFTPEEWRQYVYKMMRKPGSGLTPKTAEKIIEFLSYDAQHREKKIK